MKSIPEQSSTLAALESASGVHLQDISMLNDAIVDSINAGRVYPGNIVFHSDTQILSSAQQEQLAARFAKAGWELHFKTGTAEHPHIHIYIAGEEASYLPVIRQPDAERCSRSSSPSLSFSQRLAQWFPGLFARAAL